MGKPRRHTIHQGQQECAGERSTNITKMFIAGSPLQARAGLIKIYGDHTFAPKYIPVIEVRGWCFTIRSQEAVMISKAEGQPNSLNLQGIVKTRHGVL